MRRGVSCRALLFDNKFYLKSIKVFSQCFSRTLLQDVILYLLSKMIMLYKSLYFVTWTVENRTENKQRITTLKSRELCNQIAEFNII